MKYNIAFYCESIPFIDKTCRLEHSLGGSETMLIGMAQELARMGHFVQVFTKFEDIQHEGQYNGVWFYDHSHFKALLPSIEWDIFISLRMRNIMSAPIRAKARFLWNQDELVQPKLLMANLWQTDRLFFVSEWHKEHYFEKLPEIEAFSYVTRNGIDLQLIETATMGVKKDPYKLIYISRPERGLEPLLQIFPKILKHCPEVKLSCARYYSMYEPMPNIKAICDRADRQMAATPNCEYLGNLSKEELYREIASSRLMVYPGVPNFNETGCIAAMEAQACGTPIICTNTGALKETVADGAGVKIDGDAYSDEYHAIFIQNVLSLLVDKERYEKMQQAGYAHVEKYDYSVIADEWQAFFDNFFEERFRKEGQRIFANLMHYDDVVAARHLATELELPHEIHQAEERLAYPPEQEEMEKGEYAEHAVAPDVDEGSGRFFEIIEAVATTMMPEIAPVLMGQGKYSERMAIIASYMQDRRLRILDFACGNGALSVLMGEIFPQAEITGYDFSPQLVEVATKHAASKGVAGRVKFIEGSLSDIEGLFDIVVCGEFLEHCPDYLATIKILESHCEQDGLLVFTVPYGPMIELLPLGEEKAKHRGHVHHWAWGDIQAVFGKKEGYAPRAMEKGHTTRNNQVGHWIIIYRHTDIPTGEIDFAKKVRTTRPFEKLSICMIARNCAKWIDLCMENLIHIADEIIVATNGPDEDGTIPKLESWGARVIRLPLLCDGVPQGTPPPGNFSWLRNESIKEAKGDWIGWFDTDEILTHPEVLRKYLTDSPYNGFGLRQKHFAVDQNTVSYDVPIRMFRNGKGYEFYGCIHEHAEDGIDNPIKPALELRECDLGHIGYIHESVRRQKCLLRNYAMLKLDQKFFPERQMRDVLFARDNINFALWERDANGNQNTPEAIQQLWQAIRWYQGGPWYNNPDNRYFKLIFGFYQRALQWLQAGLEFGVRGPDGKNLRFLTLEEFSAYSKKAIDVRAQELRFEYPHLPETRIPKEA